MPTATAERPRSLRRATWIRAAVLVVLAGIVFALSYRPSESAPRASVRRPVDLTSDARHRFATVEQLVGASDLVVEGHVVATETGRVFGEASAAADDESSAIRSRITTLQIDTVLRGTSSQATLLIEEEATLADGTPVRVDGMRPGEVGDRGVWFLVASRDPDFPGYVVANAQGRYLRGPRDTLRGGDRTDPLVRAIEAEGFTALITTPTP
jgi:hypothetical protein